MIPKWLKWLTPEEEQQLKDPSRRVFSFGLLASAATLAMPVAAFKNNLAVVIHPNNAPRILPKGVIVNPYLTDPDALLLVSRFDKSLWPGINAWFEDEFMPL